MVKRQTKNKQGRQDKKEKEEKKTVDKLIKM